MTRRMLVGVISGAVLGLVCILGAAGRAAEPLGAVYLFAFWYNRLLMGLFIGALPRMGELPRLVGRGALVGIAVSFAFYSATQFADPMGFLVGAVYGVIIELTAHWLKT